ncbi:sequestosome-1-like [Lingula anatina]|uniref:Protein ref(2)P n=1 Tax=Lingula anatina TaxID=7574 RepID=A0A1S3HX56_LINAN|nr:sequestosome-1-like [Lingula anatina]|eukprot:XP_013390593.1 sequestosome-1-like [Lingula anatina]
MSLTVKAYLEKQGQQPEIRRFTIDQDVATNFSYFCKKTAQIFPSLASENFSLYWKDVEGDNIAFSSDDELTEALGQIQGDIFKVYITETGAPKQQPQEEEGYEKVHHPGVVCDGCEGQIYGPRFKCMICPDYDLCGNCEGKGLHTEHDMVRIAQPGCHGPFMGGFFPPPPPYNQGGRHGGPGPWRGHGPRGPRVSCGSCEMPWGGHKGNGPPKWMKKCFKKAWLHNMMNQQQKQQGEGEQQQQEEPNGQPPEEGATAAGSAEGGQQNANGAPGDFLKSVGESVAAMLDPLGIDVEVDVEHKGKRQRCRDGNWVPWWQQFAMWGGAPPYQTQGQGQGQNQGQSQASTTTSKDQGPKEGEKATAMEEDTGELTDASKAPVVSSAPPLDEPMQDAAPDQKQGSDTENGWTVIDGQPGPSGANQQGQQPLYPQLSQTPPHPNLKVADALVQMKQMGFSDDGGWLTHLLESKNGDIGKVLDALKPQN